MIFCFCVGFGVGVIVRMLPVFVNRIVRPSVIYIGGWIHVVSKNVLCGDIFALLYLTFAELMLL